MRLRELSPPLAVMHADFLGNVKTWADMFDHVSLESIEQGYFLGVRVFDTSGNEYAAASVEVLPRRWLGAVLSRGVRIDMDLRSVATHSANDLINRFAGHLTKNPSWWINNESVWSAEDIANGFARGHSCKDVIERLDWFAREVT